MPRNRCPNSGIPGTVQGIAYQDEDITITAFTPTQLGATTSCTFGPGIFFA